MSRTGQQRVVYQQRLANRQAVARLRRAYVKLYRQAQTKAEKPKAVQEKQE